MLCDIIHVLVGLILKPILSILLYLQVVLAANDLPSINDVTYPELIEIIAKVIQQLSY